MECTFLPAKKSEALVAAAPLAGGIVRVRANMEMGRRKEKGLS